MSSSLHWRPVKPTESSDLPDSLKFVIQKTYAMPKVFTSDDVEFLRGLDAAEIRGARTLISAIQEWGEVEVFLSY